MPLEDTDILTVDAPLPSVSGKVGERSDGAPPRSVLVVGLGSIGRRHLKVLRDVLPNAEAMVLRRPGRGLDGEPGAGIRLVHDLDAALDIGADAAIIASPAHLHLRTALALADAGVHLLVEKPLSNKVDGVSDLLSLCRAKGTVLQVGYCLRFDPSLAAVKDAIDAGRIGRPLHLRAEVGQYLPDWRPGTDYREGVSARAALGGGVLLELSHEIDYAGWIAGQVVSVQARLDRVSDLDIDVEDLAELSLEFAGGMRGSLYLDFLQRSPVRTCKVIGTRGTVVWDGIAHESRLYDAGTGQWETMFPGGGITVDGILAAQSRHFIECVRGRSEPLVSGEDGLRALKVVEAAQRSQLRGERIVL